jgi:hypothetical protein
MIDLGISSQQRQVIDALSSGASLSDAAALAGVHRNELINDPHCCLGKPLAATA